ncbi:DUF983 domain-containing protein [bacterium]|nr:DUF983 domain-containing protein [bacterium]
MSTPSALSSFLKGKCPQCREGNIFKTSVFNIRRFKETHEHCPVCHVRFESEPGFFWGAMYFSYALNVGVAIVTGVIFFSLNDDPPLGAMIGTVLGISVFFSPLVFRLARLLMMYIAAPYRKYKKGPYNKK